MLNYAILAFFIIGSANAGCSDPNPVECAANEMMCPTWDGLNECHPMTLEGYAWDYNTHEPIDCPNHCPNHCSDEQMYCDGGYEENGCPRQNTCIDHSYESAVNGEQCANHCPVTCPSDQIMCPGVVDSYTGCQFQQDYCIEASTTGGLWDEATGTYNQCPQSCPVQCGNDQKTCWGGNDETGCPRQDTCIDHGYESAVNGEWCMNHCPVTCQSDQIMCSGDYDPNTGCQMYEDYCIPASTTGYLYDEATGTYNQCPQSCPPTCGDQMLCHGGYDEQTGCEMPGWCAPHEAGCGPAM